MYNLINYASKFYVLIFTITSLTFFESDIHLKTEAIALDVGYEDDTPQEAVIAQLREIFRKSEYVYEPSWIAATANHKLFIRDATHQLQAVYIYNLVSDVVEQSIRTGHGPAELAPMGMKWMSKLDNGDVLIYDAGNYRAYRFDSLLQNGTGLRMNFRSGNAMNLHLINDSLIYMSPMNQTDFLHMYHYDGVRNVRESI